MAFDSRCLQSQSNDGSQFAGSPGINLDLYDTSPLYDLLVENVNVWDGKRIRFCTQAVSSPVSMFPLSVQCSILLGPDGVPKLVLGWPFTYFSCICLPFCDLESFAMEFNFSSQAKSSKYRLLNGKQTIVQGETGLSSPQLCVGFLFLILYPGLLLRLPPPAATSTHTHTNLTYNNFTHTQLCHIPSLTYHNFTYINLTYNNFTHTQLCHIPSLTYHNFTYTNLTYNNFTHTHTLTHTHTHTTLTYHNFTHTHIINIQ